MKRLFLLCAFFLAGCVAEPRAIAAPLPTAPPTSGLSAAVLADNVATLEMLQAAITLEAGRTATADAATRAVQQWQATQEAGQVTATAEERAALATGTAQAFGSTQTAVPLIQTQTALSITALAASQQAVTATNQAVLVTLAYSRSLNAATATQVAQVLQIQQQGESANRWKTLWDGLTYALVYSVFGCATAFFVMLWFLRGIPKRYMEVRIARLRLANVGGHAPIWLPDGAAAPQSLPFGEPAAIVNNDGTRTEIPVTDADMQPEAPARAAAPHSERPPEQQEALRFLNTCYQFTVAHPDFPNDMIPDYRALKAWAINAGHAEPQFTTGAKWQYARDRFGEALEGIPGTGTRVAKQWGTVSGLYNAVLQNRVALVGA